MNADKTVINLSRAITIALGLSLNMASVHAQAIGSDGPDDTRSGGVTRPGTIRPELPAPEKEPASIEHETPQTLMV